MAEKKCPYQAKEINPETCAELVRLGYPKCKGCEGARQDGSC